MIRQQTLTYAAKVPVGQTITSPMTGIQWTSLGTVYDAETKTSKVTLEAEVPDRD